MGQSNESSQSWCNIKALSFLDKTIKACHCIGLVLQLSFPKPLLNSNTWPHNPASIWDIAWDTWWSSYCVPFSFFFNLQESIKIHSWFIFSTLYSIPHHMVAFKSVLWILKYMVGGKMKSRLKFVTEVYDEKRRSSFKLNLYCILRLLKFLHFYFLQE